jgi:DNA-damage-inducible protein D
MTDDRALLPFDEGDGRLIRRQWHEGRWFFSVVDVVGVLTDAQIPRNYWSDLKRRLAQDEGFSQLHAKIVQLKMRSLDGKMRATDAADVETMLRIVQSIPSPKAEPIKQWLAQEGARRLDEVAGELPEQQRRHLLRGEVATQNSHLAQAAMAHGVISSRDFGVFQDWGYRGLYAGETARDIAAKKGGILDHMASTELAANLFRITQTDDKLQQLEEEGIVGKTVANQTHYAVGREVRGAIERIGGTMPEQLPTPAESIHELQRREQQRLEAERQPSLFAEGEGESGGNDES